MIELTIKNDGTGSPAIGNYDVRIVMPSLTGGGPKVINARVLEFDRALGWSHLVVKAAEALNKVEVGIDGPDPDGG